MRFETIKASMYLVWKLKFAGVTIREDGGDIILAALPTGEIVSFHLIESPIELYEIKTILNDNARRGYHTLFLLWCDLLLPPEGHLVRPYDWELGLLALYEDRIYAYEAAGSDVFVFAVHFEREGAHRHIRYGHTLNMRDLNCADVSTGGPFLAGTWRVAHFATGQQAASGGSRYAPGVPASLSVYYDRLELHVEADAETVKVAYRRMARRYHPDLNPSPDATAQMQAINEAYERIMERLEGQQKP